MRPDRVVVGVREPYVADKLHRLYEPYLRTERPFLAMSPESAEMTKYVANALLSTKISFINEMANLCERMAGDINDVRRGIGHDRRIGFQFLFPGVGYGGSCFPKDVRALASMARQLGLEPRMLDAVELTNEHQKTVMIEKIRKHFENRLEGRKIAVWGLAFKPRTDDIREASALVLIDALLDGGAVVQVHDPEALENVRQLYRDRLRYTELQMDALEGVDALAIMTEWPDYQRPNFEEMHRLMASPVIFDGRNIYDPEQMRQSGFVYQGIGR
jgi:UDPglucose 6-dehydrogenase